MHIQTEEEMPTIIVYPIKFLIILCQARNILVIECRWFPLFIIGFCLTSLTRNGETPLKNA